MGHSVPILDGAEQKAGEEYCGSFAYENNTLTMELAGAYGIDTLKSLQRTIAFDDSGITLTDHFDYAGKTITERFISKREPTVKKGEITLGKTHLFFDPSLCPTVTTETHFLHGYQGNTIPVYCIDFVLDGKEKAFTLRVEA